MARMGPAVGISEEWIAQGKSRNRSNQIVSNCPSKGGELDPEHISGAHTMQLAPYESVL